MTWFYLLTDVSVDATDDSCRVNISVCLTEIPHTWILYFLCGTQIIANPPVWLRPYLISCIILVKYQKYFLPCSLWSSALFLFLSYRVGAGTRTLSLSTQIRNFTAEPHSPTPFLPFVSSCLILFFISGKVLQCLWLRFLAGSPVPHAPSPQSHLLGARLQS